MSNKATFLGRKPASSRANQIPAAVSEPDFFRNRFDVPAHIKADVEKRGMECRWIDYKTYISEGNTHRRGWSIYRVDVSKTGEGSDSITQGVNPDGMIRRGSSVLAVRPKQMCEQHRRWNQEKANLYKRSVTNDRDDELSQVARSAGSKVDTSFDEDEDDN